MLVLSRKIGQSIVVNDNIIVKIVSVDGDNVKLGIEAPGDIGIFRQEVYDAIKEENRGSAITKIEMDITEVAQLLQKKKDK